MGQNRSMRWRLLIRMAIAVSALAGGPAAGSTVAQSAPIVAAASDLNFALSEVARQFTADTGQRLELVFGASGTLTRQIRDGAPFELFLSADEAFVAQLQQAGLAKDAGVLYGVGRLALFAPTGSPLVPAEGLAGVRRLLDSGRLTRFAMANPEHAPYGRAAEAALRAHGLWDAIRPRLVLGDNVTQAAQFATTGNAAGGLVAHSLVVAPVMAGRGTFSLVPETDHPPLRQRMVRLKRAGPVAERFYLYLQQPGARIILERYGFTLPR
jgi:molybdate transport system substrate-binding protein